MYIFHVCPMCNRDKVNSVLNTSMSVDAAVTAHFASSVAARMNALFYLDIARTSVYIVQRHRNWEGHGYKHFTYTYICKCQIIKKEKKRTMWSELCQSSVILKIELAALRAKKFMHFSPFYFIFALSLPSFFSLSFACSSSLVVHIFAKLIYFLAV